MRPIKSKPGQYRITIKLVTMQPKKRHISVSGLIISTFVFMSAIVFLTEGEKYYWTLLLFIPVILFLSWDAMGKDSFDIRD